jgi:transposase
LSLAREAPTYRFTQFADRYRSYVASLRRSMRQVHRAGEKLFVDYAGQSVPYGREGDRAQIRSRCCPWRATSWLASTRCA